MSGVIIDLSGALEERKFKEKEDKLKQMREAFRAARLEAKANASKNSPGLAATKRGKKKRHPSR